MLLWEKELAAAQFKLIQLTIIVSVQNLSDLETKFISKFSLYTVQEDWLLKTRNHLEKYERNFVWKKSRKLECWCLLAIYIFHIWHVLGVITNFLV